MTTKVTYRKVFSFPPTAFAKADGTGSNAAIGRAYAALNGSVPLPAQPKDCTDKKWAAIVGWSETIIGKAAPFHPTEGMGNWGYIRPFDAVVATFWGMSRDEVLESLKAASPAVREALAGLTALDTKKRLDVFCADNTEGFEGLTALRSAILTLQDQLEEERGKLLAKATEAISCQTAWYGDKIISIHSAQYKPSRRKDGARRKVYVAKYPTPVEFGYAVLGEGQITGKVDMDKNGSVYCVLTMGENTVTAHATLTSGSPGSNAVRKAIRLLHEAKGAPFTTFARNIPGTILHWESVAVVAPTIDEKHEGVGGTDTSAH